MKASKYLMIIPTKWKIMNSNENIMILKQIKKSKLSKEQSKVPTYCPRDTKQSLSKLVDLSDIGS